MSARRAIAPAAAALLLATLAHAAFAQDSDGATLRDVAAVKAASGISPDIFARLEAFRPATPPRLLGTLHRVVLKRAITRDGKDVGTDRRTIDFLPASPGYLFETSTTATSTSSNVSTFLEYGPFLTVQSHTKRHVTQTFPHLDIDTTTTTRLSGVTLPASFDGVMTPHATWQIENESDTAIEARNVLKSIDRSNFTIIKRTCETSERQPASTVAPALLGTAVSIKCQRPDTAGDELAMVYLDDYGVFFPVAIAFKQAPQGTQITNTFVVDSVVVDAPPAGTLVAQPPPVAAAALPSLAQARAAYQRHDDATAFRGFTALAEAGEMHAQVLLSLMYSDGRGTPVDHVAAAGWLRKAADQGVAIAQVALGIDYRDGTGVPRDPQAAFGWWMKAAQQGNVDGQAAVGRAYSTGDGVAKDMQAALDWTRKAAEQGHREAQANLGILYSGDLGIAADYAQAALWARRAADRGSPDGQNQLCFLYARGRGVAQDIEQADFWCVLASNGGSAQATRNRTMMESGMTPDQRARILAKTLAWKPVAPPEVPAPGQ